MSRQSILVVDDDQTVLESLCDELGDRYEVSAAHSGTEAMMNDVAALKRDFSSLLEHLKLTATNGANGAADQIDDGARRLYRNVAAEGSRSFKVIGTQIEERPLAALLIALGIGFLGGRMLSR